MGCTSSRHAERYYDADLPFPNGMATPTVSRSPKAVRTLLHSLPVCGPSVCVEQYEYMGGWLIPSCTVNPYHPRNHAVTPSRDAAESLAACFPPTAHAVRLDRRAESEDIGHGRMA